MDGFSDVLACCAAIKAGQWFAVISLNRPISRPDSLITNYLYKTFSIVAIPITLAAVVYWLKPKIREDRPGMCKFMTGGLERGR